MSDLEKRIASLEAINSIENLKHTYLNACDAKDVQAMMLTLKRAHVISTMAKSVYSITERI